MASVFVWLLFWSALCTLFEISEQDGEGLPCIVFRRSSSGQVSGLLLQALQELAHCRRDEICDRPCKPRLEVGGRLWTGGLQTALLNQGIRVADRQGLPIYSRNQLLSLEKDIPKVFIVIPEAKMSDGRVERLVQRVYDWMRTDAGFKITQTALIVPTFLEPDLIRAFRSRIQFGLPEVAQLDDQLKNRRPFWFRWVYSQRYMVETLTEIVENLEMKQPKNLSNTNQAQSTDGKQAKIDSIL